MSRFLKINKIKQKCKVPALILGSKNKYENYER